MVAAMPMGMISMMMIVTDGYLYSKLTTKSPVKGLFVWAYLDLFWVLLCCLRVFPAFTVLSSVVLPLEAALVLPTVSSCSLLGEALFPFSWVDAAKE